MRCEAKLRNCLGRHVTGLLAGHCLLLAKPEGHIFPDRQRIKQGAELERHAKAAAHHLQLPASGIDHFLAIDTDRAAIGPNQPKKAFQGHGFAATGRADDGQRFLGRDLKVDAPKDLFVAK